MRVEKVVVGIDFSPASIEAARWVSRYFAPGAELVLAHVISIPVAPPIVRSRFPRRELLVDTVREGAEKRLKEISLSLGAGRVWLELREGEPVEALTTLARDFSAGLIVAGAHGARAGLQSVLGSTAEHLARESAHPVLLVNHPQPTAPRQILVPLEKPEHARAALNWAATLSDQHGARVTTIHVATRGIAGGTLAALAVVSGSPMVDMTTLHAASESDEWMKTALAAGIPRDRVTSEIVDGEPIHEILDARNRHDADLIVMSRRSAGSLRRTVLGSVVSGVLREAPCPVLVVPDTVA